LTHRSSRTATAACLPSTAAPFVTYHHPAISFRDDPPHSRLAKYVV